MRYVIIAAGAFALVACGSDAGASENAWAERGAANVVASPAAASSLASASATASKPVQANAHEANVLQQSYVWTNSWCRGGSGEATLLVCDWRKAIGDILLRSDLCFTGAKWRACTAEDRREYAEYSDWYLDGPSGQAVTREYLDGDWVAVGRDTYPFKRSRYCDRDSESVWSLGVDSSVVGPFVRYPDGSSEIVVPWTEDVMLMLNEADPEREEDDPAVDALMLVRCSN